MGNRLGNAVHHHQRPALQVRVSRQTLAEVLSAPDEKTARKLLGLLTPQPEVSADAAA